jgi:hypothetical protein
MSNRMRRRSRKPVTAYAVNISISMPVWLLAVADGKTQLLKLDDRSAYFKRLVREDNGIDETAVPAQPVTAHGHG